MESEEEDVHQADYPILAYKYIGARIKAASESNRL